MRQLILAIIVVLATTSVTFAQPRQPVIAVGTAPVFVSPGVGQTPLVSADQGSAADQLRQDAVSPRVGMELGWLVLNDPSIDTTFPLGWNVAVVGHLTPIFGIVGEVGGTYKTFDHLSIKFHNLLSGGRVSARLAGRAKLFGQMLLGVTYLRESVLGLGWGSRYFMIQPGGGVSLPLSETVGVQLQVDVRRISGSGGSTNQIRFISAVVISSGRRDR